MSTDDDQRPVANIPILPLDDERKVRRMRTILSIHDFSVDSTGEIVDRRADHHEIGGFELGDHPFRQRKARVIVRGGERIAS